MTALLETRNRIVTADFRLIVRLRVLRVRISS